MYSEYVYVLKSESYYKIGRTNELHRRMGELKIQLPFRAELFKVFNTDNSKALEKHFHRIYAEYRANGEWFILSDYDAALLHLLPSSISFDDLPNLFSLWKSTLETAREAAGWLLDSLENERLLEQEIADAVSDSMCEFPDSWGDLEFSDMLAFECPYPLGPEDMEWVVAEELEKE